MKGLESRLYLLLSVINDSYHKYKKDIIKYSQFMDKVYDVLIRFDRINDIIIANKVVLLRSEVYGCGRCGKFTGTRLEVLEHECEE